MTHYSFSPHCASLIATQSGSPLQKPFALIDIAQLPKEKNLLRRAAPDAAHRLLFAECFAHAALALSPVVVELSDDGEVATRQIFALDATCKSLPVMSILHSDMTLDDLTLHLQARLRIEVDGTAFLLRLADSQMMSATDSIFLPAQRARFYEGVTSWFIVDHQGSLANLCCRPQAQPSAGDLPLQLDEAQANALLTAAIVPTVASQVRHHDASFAQRLTHAEQIAFVASAVDAARLTGLTDDTELSAWTLARWDRQCDDFSKPIPDRSTSQ